jgi:uncharacterized protein
VLGSLRTNRRVLARAAMTRPLERADQEATGERSDFFQGLVANPSGNEPFWRDRDLGDPAKVTIPTLLVAGWYDVFLPRQLADDDALRSAGQTPRLVVGPWAHGHFDMAVHAFGETLAWLDDHLGASSPPPTSAPDDTAIEPPRARVFITGSDRWVDLASWPPPTRPVRYHLQPGGELSLTPPPASDPDTYHYDPADPTPTVGGTGLHKVIWGPQDNQRVESRPDVLVYTSAPLENDHVVMGAVRAQVHFATTARSGDVFVRVCDVSPKGTSINVCDGISPLLPDHRDGNAVTVALWPTAHSFRRGHRIRIQIASAAYPRFARDLGNGEPLATGVEICASDQTVFHDPDHPSFIELCCPPPALANQGDST